MSDKIINDAEVSAAIKALHRNFTESGSFVKEWNETFSHSASSVHDDNKYELVIKIRATRVPA